MLKQFFNKQLIFIIQRKNKYPYLNYKHTDVKQMLFSAIGNFSGFLGYYNPFTGEAQVNTICRHL